MIEQVYSAEEFFIWINRTFRFLREHGFGGSNFLLNGREHSSVSYYNYITKKKITIIEFYGPEYPDGLDIRVETKGFLGFFKNIKTLKDYFGSDVKVESIRRLAEMVQEHEGLMKELTG